MRWCGNGYIALMCIPVHCAYPWKTLFKYYNPSLWTRAAPIWSVTNKLLVQQTAESSVSLLTHKHNWSSADRFDNRCTNCNIRGSYEYHRSPARHQWDTRTWRAEIPQAKVTWPSRYNGRGGKVGIVATVRKSFYSFTNHQQISPIAFQWRLSKLQLRLRTNILPIGHNTREAKAPQANMTWAPPSEVAAAWYQTEVQQLVG